MPEDLSGKDSAFSSVQREDTPNEVRVKQVEELLEKQDADKWCHNWTM